MLPGHINAVTALAIGGGHLATGSSDETIRCVVESGRPFVIGRLLLELTRSFHASVSTNLCLKFSNRLYDLVRLREMGAMTKQEGTISGIQFCDTTHMLSAADDGTICIWRTKDWEPLVLMKGHK
jgi:WD40 repeat protein